MTVHIESEKKDIAKIVLMPGDPKRAKFIAENYLDNYKLVNNVRGMTAYSGYYKNKYVTVFPSGMGIPSMGIYSYELFKDYDVDVIIRIGSMGAYDNHLKVNDLVLVNSCFSNSNYALEMSDKKINKITADTSLNKQILSTSLNIKVSINEGNTYCSEAFYSSKNKNIEASNMGLLGVEMENFALFYNAYSLKKKASSILTVSDLVNGSEKLSSEQREKGLNNMIKLALEVVSNYK